MRVEWRRVTARMTHRTCRACQKRQVVAVYLRSRSGDTAYLTVCRECDGEPPVFAVALPATPRRPK